MKIRKCIATVVIGIMCMVTTVHGEEYEYDKLNRVTKVIYEDGSYVTYEYDANGNIVKTDVYEVLHEENTNTETEEPIQSQLPTVKPEPAVSQTPVPSPVPTVKPEPAVSQTPVPSPVPTVKPKPAVSQMPMNSQMPSDDGDKSTGKTQLDIKITEAIQKILVKINKIKDKVYEQAAMKQENIEGLSRIQSDKTEEYDTDNNKKANMEGQQKESNNMDSESTNDGHEFESVLQFVEVIEKVITALINWIQVVF